MTTDGKFNINNLNTVKIPTVNTAIGLSRLPQAALPFSSLANPVGLFYDDNYVYVIDNINDIHVAPRTDPLNSVPHYQTKVGGQSEFISNVYPSLIGNYYYAYGASDDLGGIQSGSIYKAHKDSPLAWYDTGSDNASGSNHAMIYYDGSNIYLYGGIDNGSNVLNTIDVASVSTPTTFVASGNTLPAARVAGALAVVGSTIIMYGGSANANDSENTIYTASTSTPTTWSVSGNTIPRPIFGAVAYVDANFVYLYGGTDSTTAQNLNTIYRAPIGTPTVLTLNGSTLPCNMTGSRIFTSGDYLYMIGTSDGAGTGYLKASISDPLTWTEINPSLLPSSKMSTHVVVQNNTIYALGGFTTAGTGTTTIQSASVNFPIEWKTEVATLPAALGAGQLIKTKSYYYIVGGAGTTGNYYRAPIATPTTWTLIDNTGPTRPYGQAFIVDDNLWYFGGESAATPVPVATGWRAVIENGEIIKWKTNPASVYQSFALPIALTRFALFQAGDYIYVVGGITTGLAMNTNVYRCQKNRVGGQSGFTTWTNVGTITNAMASPAVVIINNKVYLIGGGPNTSINTSDDYVLSADMTDLANGIVSFTEQNTNTYPLAESTPVFVNDNLYLIGGRETTNGSSLILKNLSWSTHNLVLPRVPESSASLPTLDLKTGTLGSYSSFQRTGLPPWKVTDK